MPFAHRIRFAWTRITVNRQSVPNIPTGRWFETRSWQIFFPLESTILDFQDGRTTRRYKQIVRRFAYKHRMCQSQKVVGRFMESGFKHFKTELNISDPRVDKHTDQHRLLFYFEDEMKETIETSTIRINQPIVVRIPSWGKFFFHSSRSNRASVKVNKHNQRRRRCFRSTLRLTAESALRHSQYSGRFIFFDCAYASLK